jgi:ATP synthase F1 complex assembly factor 2
MPLLSNLRLLSSSLLTSKALYQNTQHQLNSTRLLSSLLNKERKRFYKHVTISESFDTENNKKLFEINLDKRKLKTPSGKLFQVDNEILAQMVGFEWQSQTASIKQNTMHLTSLLNTSMDNPHKITKETLINALSDYLSTDTILYFDEPHSTQNLLEIQEAKWKPLIGWFNSKFAGLNLNAKHDLSDDSDLKETLKGENSFRSYLSTNFDLNTLIAFNYISECLKSVILTVGLLERKIGTVEEACGLSILEQAFQSNKWGKVEWYHDINENETLARVSAALLVIYLSNSSKYLIK